MPAIKSKVVFIIFFVFVSCSVMGQVSHKKNLTEADYHLWGTLQINTVSAKGDWVSYTNSYENGLDTLFVRNSTATKTFTFPKGRDGRFAKDNWFACLLPEKKLLLADLRTNRQRELPDVVQYAFSNDGRVLVTLNAKQQLNIGKPDGSATDVIESVTGFYLNNGGTAMVYTIAKEKGSLHYCPLDGINEHFKMLANEAGCTFESVLWDAKGNAFSFVKRYPDDSDIRNGRNLNLYRLKEGNYFSFDANNYAEIKKQSTLTDLFWNRFSIAVDGKRVFFYMTDEGEDNFDNPIVQVWNGSAPRTYRQVEVEGSFEKTPKCVVWFPDSGKFRPLTDSHQPKVLLNGDMRFALSYNPAGKRPQFTMLSKTDWYISDIEKGGKKIFLENHVCDMTEIIPSAGGKYIAYRRDNDWWAYEISTGRHFNMTKQLPFSVINDAYDYSGQKPAYGVAGWTANDQQVLLYDEFDLWLVDLNGMKCKRLTMGREKQIEFRLAYGLGVTERISNFDGYVSPLIDLTKVLYLKAKSKITKQMGYYRWNGREEPFIFADKLINQFGFTKESSNFYCRVQDFDESPSVVCIGKAGALKTVAKTNTQQSNYYWSKARPIDYRNSKNQLLQAVLHYPANYDELKKYPMVVYIYEKRSQYIHDYINPTLYNGGGINITNLTSQGYFVLEPDIEYEMDNVGLYATDCVVSATKAVINMGMIQTDRIALHGHSFGGYEASFIATQTTIFATVIVGASITDAVMWYNSLGWNSGKTEAWRFEDYQSRMSTSFYENKDAYLKNSPIMFADKITAPMLIWTGEADRHVHYFQSVQLYNALRRLGKKEIMLIYPENRHVLTVAKQQADFTHKYEEWLSYYLKGTAPAEWMKKEVN